MVDYIDCFRHQKVINNYNALAKKETLQKVQDDRTARGIYWMFNLTTRSNNLLIVVVLIIYLVSGITVIKKAKENRTAFLRWSDHTEMIKHRKMIYGAEGGSYPNLPFMLMILMPFHKMVPMGRKLLLFNYNTVFFCIKSSGNSVAF